MERDELIGTWRLVAFESRDEAGNITYPYGEKPEGFIVYAADGYMAYAMQTADRPPFVEDDILGGTEAEQAAAYASYRSYCGTYAFFGDRVEHYVRVSLFPNRMGEVQRRRVTREGAHRIALHTPPMRSAGKTQTMRLLWEKALPFVPDAAGE